VKLSASPITAHQFEGLSFYLKRDDLLHPEFSGNKARKFASLFEGDFPSISTIIGYGSCQANSLYSLAALAKLKGWQLEYYVNQVPNWLKQNPIGNYEAALSLGATIHDVSELAGHANLKTVDYIHQTRTFAPHELFVEEGGRDPIAEQGVKGLATELLEWIASHNIVKPFIALPAGTGTTSLYLQKHLRTAEVPVLTSACVGGESYLSKQFFELDGCEPPQILSLPEKHHFGKLYAKNYHIWQSLCEQTKVEFDLLYDPWMWRCILGNLEFFEDKTLIYIHQGGLLGNHSMIKRYKRKFEPDFTAKG
jgi:1-aminocyclopropane-1-carboxylate deaminase/D-cysteine desulfhydrase-like pyridoxal-dependent ACC family enzyme